MSEVGGRRNGGGTRQSGPVFIPPRRPSSFARSLLDGEPPITAYDDLWFAGRPRS